VESRICAVMSACDLFSLHDLCELTRQKRKKRCVLSGRSTEAGWCEPSTIGAGTLLVEPSLLLG
jgi:hypothetical protein